MNKLIFLFNNFIYLFVYLYLFICRKAIALFMIPLCSFLPYWISWFFFFFLLESSRSSPTFFFLCDSKQEMRAMSQQYDYDYYYQTCKRHLATWSKQELISFTTWEGYWKQIERQDLSNSLTVFLPIKSLLLVVASLIPPSMRSEDRKSLAPLIAACRHIVRQNHYFYIYKITTEYQRKKSSSLTSPFDNLYHCLTSFK